MLNSSLTTAEGTLSNKVSLLNTQSVPILANLEGAGYALQFFGNLAGEIFLGTIESGIFMVAILRSFGIRERGTWTKYSRVASALLSEV